MMTSMKKAAARENELSHQELVFPLPLSKKKKKDIAEKNISRMISK